MISKYIGKFEIMSSILGWRTSDMQFKIQKHGRNYSIFTQYIKLWLPFMYPNVYWRNWKAIWKYEKVDGLFITNSEWTWTLWNMKYRIIVIHKLTTSKDLWRVHYQAWLIILLKDFLISNSKTVKLVLNM